MWAGPGFQDERRAPIIWWTAGIGSRSEKTGSVNGGRSGASVRRSPSCSRRLSRRCRTTRDPPAPPGPRLVRVGDRLADRVAVGHLHQVDAARRRQRVPLPQARVHLHQPQRAVARVALVLDLRDAVESERVQQAAGAVDRLVVPLGDPDPARADPGRRLEQLAAAEDARHAAVRIDVAPDGPQASRRRPGICSWSIGANSAPSRYAAISSLGRFGDDERDPVPPLEPRALRRLHDGRVTDDLGRLGGCVLVRRVERRGQEHPGTPCRVVLEPLGLIGSISSRGPNGSRSDVGADRLTATRYSSWVGKATAPCGRASQISLSSAANSSGRSCGCGQTIGAASRDRRPSAWRR